MEGLDQAGQKSTGMGDLRRMYCERLKPMGLTYEDFIKVGALMSPLEEKKYLKYGFPTVRQFELIPLS